MCLALVNTKALELDVVNLPLNLKIATVVNDRINSRTTPSGHS